MPLNLMYITNNPDIALIAENAGVDRIFVDMEYIGKSDRQCGMDSVQSHHTFQDIERIRAVLTKADLLVRCNPIHEKTQDYSSSEDEINRIIECGADIIMLPYFKTTSEVETFLKCVGGRVKTMLLVETPEAVENIDEILNLQGIDFVHVGINDLSLGYHKKFMFELLTDGTVEILCSKFKHKGLPYGFGGIASLGKGMVPAEMIIKEHYRLGSSCAILSRSFCDCNKVIDLYKLRTLFFTEIENIRLFEKMCSSYSSFFEDNERLLKQSIDRIVDEL